MAIATGQDWASPHDVYSAAKDGELSSLCQCDRRALLLAGHIARKFGLSVLERTLCLAVVQCARTCTPPADQPLPPPPVTPPPVTPPQQPPPLLPPAQACPQEIPPPVIWEPKDV